MLPPPRHMRQQAYVHRHWPCELLWRAERKPRHGGGALGYSCGVNSGAPRRHYRLCLFCLSWVSTIVTHKLKRLSNTATAVQRWAAALHRCSRVARAAPRSLRSEQVAHNAAHWKNEHQVLPLLFVLWSGYISNRKLRCLWSKRRAYTMHNISIGLLDYWTVELLGYC